MDDGPGIIFTWMEDSLEKGRDPRVKIGRVEGREYTWNGRRRSRKVSGGGMKGGAREKLVEEAIRRCVGN